MTVTLSGFIVVVVFAILGYFRGIYRILATFISFFLAAMLAKTFSSLLLSPVSQSGIIPKSLVPLAGQIIAGIILFILFHFVAGRILKMREARREKLEKPRMATGERISGALFGTAWGLFLFLFILTGIHLIGNVEEVLIQPPKSKMEEEIKAQTFSEGKFVTAKEQIEASVFGPIVKKTDPVDEKIKGIFENLTTVVNDSRLYEYFKNHPDIERFTNDPRLLALSKDEQIQRQLQERQYFELLDNPKIASLLNDAALISDLKNVDLREILREVIENKSREGQGGHPMLSLSREKMKNVLRILSFVETAG